MPVIVIGADTPIGADVVEALLARQGEVRAFVTDPDAGLALKARRVKVAVGDVSDFSHVEAASLHCFTAVLVGAAASDGRERSFAHTATEVLEGWAAAAAAARVRRAIWVLSREESPPAVAAAEQAVVTTEGVSAEEVARRVARLDEAAAL